MTRNYKLIQEGETTENTLIEIEDSVTTTNRQQLTIAQLKEQHAECLARIQEEAERADDLADTMQAICTKFPDVAMHKVPAKVIDSLAKNTKVPPKKK